MCGILGFVNRNKKLTGDVFIKALSQLSHRGPDDAGIYQEGNLCLGHRRLSIIDLSDNAHQPMSDIINNITIVFNGEIYNYIELKATLEKYGHNFKTKSDTEVLLKAYAHWGVDCLRHLNGMWSFCIYDASKKILFFSRDRFGVKPFYYIFQKSIFSFSSEPKAILSLLPEERILNESTLYDFLMYGKLYEDNKSFYKNICSLASANCGIYNLNNNNLKIWEYWNYPDKCSNSTGHSKDMDEFNHLFNDAVKIRLRSDVEVGITLSGGLDSSAILGAMSNHLSDVKCYTSVYPDSKGESVWARKVTDHYGLRLIEVEASRENWISELENIYWHMDGPGYSPAVYPSKKIMDYASSNGTKVIIEGQGADEELGGYPQYCIKYLNSLLMNPIESGAINSKFMKFSNSLRNVIATFGLKVVLMWYLRETFPALKKIKHLYTGAGLSLLSEEYAAQYKNNQFKDIDLYQSDKVNNMLINDHSKSILPGLLHYGDIISMSASVEARQPFLDYRLVEWLFNKCSDIKINNGETKWLLRQYLKRINLNFIAERKDKQGYPTPIDNWMAHDDGKILKELLLSPDAKIRKYINFSKIKRIVDRHVDGNYRAGNHLYRLLTTEIWLNQCI